MRPQDSPWSVTREAIPIRVYCVVKIWPRERHASTAHSARPEWMRGRARSLGYQRGQCRAFCFDRLKVTEPLCRRAAGEREREALVVVTVLAREQRGLRVA
jgi:hypothetical protein